MILNKTLLTFLKAIGVLNDSSVAIGIKHHRETLNNIRKKKNRLVTDFFTQRDHLGFVPQ